MADEQTNNFLAANYPNRKRLGEGYIYRVTKPTGSVSILKEVRYDILQRYDVQGPGNEKARVRAKSEALLLEKLKHDNIVELFATHEIQDRSLFLEMEFCAGGSLHDAIYSQQGKQQFFGEFTQIRPWFYQIANAVNYLHDKGIIHRDLKPHNIMFTDETRTTIKLIGFALATRKPAVGEEEKMDPNDPANLLSSNDDAPGKIRRVGMIPYMAPEIFMGQEADHLCDVWALGVTLYETAMLDKPFHGKNVLELSSVVSSGVFHTPMDQNQWSWDLCNLVYLMLRVEQHERPLMPEIMALMWSPDELRKLLKEKVDVETLISSQTAQDDFLAPSFETFNVPTYSRATYFERPNYEEEVLRALQTVCSEPEKGVLAVVGEGGVGKTMTMAGLFMNKDNFANKCKLGSVIWLNCYLWRNEFDEEQFEAELLKGVKDRHTEVDDLQDLQEHYQGRLLLCFDDVYNSTLLHYVRDNLSRVACCIITRDEQLLSNLAQITVRIDTLTDEEIRRMLSSCFDVQSRISDPQLFDAIVELCCGLPLIADLISKLLIGTAPIQCNEVAKEVVENSNKPKEDNSFLFSNRLGDPRGKELSSLAGIFKISLERIDESKRKKFKAILLFEPNEEIYPADLAMLWYDPSNELSDFQNITYASTEARLSFVRKSLLREQSAGVGNEATYFVLPQILHTVAMNYFLAADGCESIEKLRLNVASGECFRPIVVKNCDLLYAITQKKNRPLLDKILMRCDTSGLADILILQSADSKKMSFVRYLYNFDDWQDTSANILDAIDFGDYATTYAHLPDSFRDTNVLHQELEKRIKSTLKYMEPMHSCQLLTAFFRRCRDNAQVICKVLGGSEVNDGERISFAMQLLADFSSLEPAYDRRLLVAAISPQYSLRRNACSQQYKHRTFLLHVLREIEGSEIFSAASRGDLATLQSHSLNELRVALTETGLTPLMVAALFGQLEAAKFFCKIFDGNTTFSTTNGWLPLFFAAECGSLDVVEYLISVYPESLNHKDHRGETALVVASRAGHLSIVNYLCGLASEIELSKAFLAAASTGHLSVAKLLYESYPSVVEYADQDGHTPLSSAVYNPDVVEFLLCEYLQAARKFDNVGRLPLQVAAEEGNPDAVKLIYDCYPDAVSVPSKDGFTPLHYAVLSGNLQVVQFLYKKYPKAADIRTRKEITPLYIAVSNGSADIVKFFVEDCPGVREQLVQTFTTGRRTCLMEATVSRNIELVKYLYNACPESIRIQSPFGETILQLAVARSNADIVKFICKTYPELLRIPHSHMESNLLHWAMMHGSVDVVRYLCRICPEAFTEDSLVMAAQAGRLEIVRFFFERYGNQIKASKGNSLINVLTSAAAFRHLQLLKYIWGQCADVLSRENPADLLPILWAAIAGPVKVFATINLNENVSQNIDKRQTEIIAFLHEANNQIVKQVTQDGTTAFLVAVRYGNMGLVKLLYEMYPTAISTANKAGVTPIYVAIEKKSLPLVEFLLEKEPSLIWWFCQPKSVKAMARSFRAKPETVDSVLASPPRVAHTPLMVAVKLSSLEVVRLLYEKSPESSRNFSNEDGDTAFSISVEEGKVNVMTFFCENNEQWLKEVDSIEESTPLFEAVNSLYETYPKLFFNVTPEDRDAFEALGRAMLLEVIQNGLPFSAMYAAIVYSQMDAVRFIYGKHPNMLIWGIYTPFHVAVILNRLNIAEWLFEQYPEVVDQVDTRRHKTPLLVAVHMGHLECVKFLTEQCHAALTLEDEQTGYAPFLLAATEGHQAILEHLHKINGSLVRVKHPTSGLSPLGLAIANVHAEAATLLYELYPDALLPENNDGQSPFHHAVYKGGSLQDFVESVCKLKPDVLKLEDQDGNTPFELLVERDHIEMAQFLLSVDITAYIDDLPRLLSRGSSKAAAMLCSWRPEMIPSHVSTLLQSLSRENISLVSSANKVSPTSLRVIRQLTKTNLIALFDAFADQNAILIFHDAMQYLRTVSWPERWTIEGENIAILRSIASSADHNYLLFEPHSLLNDEIAIRLAYCERADSTMDEINTSLNVALLVAVLLSRFTKDQKGELEVLLSQSLTKWIDKDLNFEYQNIEEYDEFEPMLSETAPLIATQFAMWFLSKNITLDLADAVPKLKVQTGIAELIWKAVERHQNDTIISQYGETLLALCEYS